MAFNIDVWETLAGLVARYSGATLPAPVDEAHCSDCASWGPVFELGPSRVCARHYVLRVTSAERTKV